MATAATYRFDRAIVRRPAGSVVRGLRAVDTGDPDPARFVDEHGGYVAALRSAGVEVVELDALDRFPDSVFVEDAVLCLGRIAVLMRPGEPSRRGEPETVRPVLEAEFERVVDLPERADLTIEGGDILVTGRHVLVGLSGRTNEAGYRALESVVAELGLRSRRVETPAEILHFKTACGLLDDETVFATRALAASGALDGYRVVEAPEGEEAVANLIRVNDRVILRSGFPRTADLLARLGYRPRPIPLDEAARIDGGPSCLSLRFQSADPPAP